MGNTRRQPPAQADPPDSLLQDLAQAFFDLSLAHRASFQGALQSVLTENNVGVAGIQVLHCLSEGSLTMRELAKKSFLEPSSLTGVIDKLELRGWVSRKAAATDRRIKQVALTRSGEAFRSRLMARFREPVPWMASFSPPEQQQLIDLLRKACAFIQAHKPPSGS